MKNPYMNICYLLIGSIGSFFLSICAFSNNNCISTFHLSGQWNVINMFFNYIEENISSKLLGIIAAVICLISLFYILLNIKNIINKKKPR